MIQQHKSSNSVHSYAIPEVLSFYQQLPFNYYGSIQKQTESLVSNAQKVLETNTCLIPVLKKTNQVLDVGCGAGFMANSIALNYSCSVLGINFNPVAVKRAQQVAIKLNLHTKFLVEDLFLFTPKTKYDLVLSIGVLHHTQSCHDGIRCLIQNCLSEAGLLYIGLYHKFGRAPFLRYFKNLMKKGLSERDLFQKYAELHSTLHDETHLQSWFRDQVLHPYESQHTLKEIFELMDSTGMEIISTSINKFQPIGSRKDLFDLEEEMEEIGETALKQKRYFPGFFTFLAKKSLKF